MIRVDVHDMIPRPPEEVFARLTDIDRYPDGAGGTLLHHHGEARTYGPVRLVNQATLDHLVALLQGAGSSAEGCAA